MSFTLRWNNPNTIATVVNIYRDTKDISPAALPSPLATLSNGETSYRDTTAVPGQTYYYLLTTTANGKTVAASSQKYTVATRRGIGPQTIVSGDDRLGYYGQVIDTDSWYGSDNPAAFTAMFPSAYASTDRVPLYKFCRNGRIFYIPTSFGIGFATWAALYQNGLVYGRDDNGPENGYGSLPPTPQSAKTVFQNDTYRWRLARGLSGYSDPAAFAFNDAYQLKEHDAVSELTAFNEFNDLLYPLVQDVPTKQRVPNILQASTTYFGGAGVAAVNPQVNGGVVCMEHDTAQDRVMHRGLFQTATGPTNLSLMQRINYVGPAQAGRYIPIIELVE